MRLLSDFTVKMRLGSPGGSDSKRTAIQPVLRNLSTDEVLLTSEDNFENMHAKMRIVKSRNSEEMHLTEFIDKYQHEDNSDAGAFGNGVSGMLMDSLMEKQANERKRLAAQQKIEANGAFAVAVEPPKWGEHSSLQKPPEKATDTTVLHVKLPDKSSERSGNKVLRSTLNNPPKGQGNNPMRGPQNLTSPSNKRSKDQTGRTSIEHQKANAHASSKPSRASASPERTTGSSAKRQPQPKVAHPASTVRQVSPSKDSPSKSKKKLKNMKPGPMLRYYQQHNKSPPRELPRSVYPSSVSPEKRGIQSKSGFTVGAHGAARAGGQEKQGPEEDGSQQLEAEDPRESPEEHLGDAGLIRAASMRGGKNVTSERPKSPGPVKRPTEMPRSASKFHEHRNIVQSRDSSKQGAPKVTNQEISRSRRGEDSGVIAKRTDRSRRAKVDTSENMKNERRAREKHREGASRRKSWNSEVYTEASTFAEGGSRYHYNAKKRVWPKRYAPPPPPKSESSFGDVAEEILDQKACDYFEASRQHWKLGTVYYRNTIPPELEALYKTDMHVIQAVGAANSRWGKPWGL